MSKPRMAKKSGSKTGPEIVGPKKLGQQLADARQKRGQSIDQIADDLCIRSCYLKAMETAKIADLPDGVFAVGFFKNYADYLGLDAGELTPSFRAMIGLAPVETPIADVRPVSTNDYVTNMTEARRAKMPGWVPALAGGVSVVAVWFGFTALESPSVGESTESLLVAAAEPIVAPIEAGAVNELGEVVADRATFTAGADEKTTLGLSVFPAAVAEQDSKIDGTRILAVEDVWVSLMDQQGDLIWEGVLPAGEHYAPETGGGFLITTSNAGAIDFVVAENSERLGERGGLVDGKLLGAKPQQLPERAMTMSDDNEPAAD